MTEELVSLRRLDPEQDQGRLVACEQLARYLWASQVVAGCDVLDAGCGVGSGISILSDAGARRVTGVDRDPAAIEQAARTIQHPAEVCVGDLSDLAFATSSFDFVLCFAVIEHVSDQVGALEELQRILRPEGVLLISKPTPNDDRTGQTEQTREPVAQNFEGLLRKHFRTVELYRQQPWFGSVVERRAEVGGQHDRQGTMPRYHDLRGGSAPDELVLAAATNRPAAPALNSIGVLAAPFELRRWHERLMEARRENERLMAAVARHSAVERRVETLTARLELAERGNVRIAELERDLRERENVLCSYESSIVGRVGRLMLKPRAGDR